MQPFLQVVLFSKMFTYNNLSQTNLQNGNLAYFASDNNQMNVYGAKSYILTKDYAINHCAVKLTDAGTKPHSGIIRNGLVNNKKTRSNLISGFHLIDYQTISNTSGCEAALYFVRLLNGKDGAMDLNARASLAMHFVNVNQVKIDHIQKPSSRIRCINLYKLNPFITCKDFGLNSLTIHQVATLARELYNLNLYNFTCGIYLFKSN